MKRNDGQREKWTQANVRPSSLDQEKLFIIRRLCEIASFDPQAHFSIFIQMLSIIQAVMHFPVQRKMMEERREGAKDWIYFSSWVLSEASVNYLCTKCTSTFIEGWIEIGQKPSFKSWIWTKTITTEKVKSQGWFYFVFNLKMLLKYH